MSLPTRLLCLLGVVFSIQMLKAAISTNKVEQKVQIKGFCVAELNLILDYIYDGKSVRPKSDINNFYK